MKHQMVLAALLAVCLSASAQNEEKKATISKNAELKYAVANDGKTKEGLYYISNVNSKTEGLWLQGHYKNNVRTGVWYFFDAKEKLVMRYNYDQKKLLYVDTNALKNVSVRVLTADADAAKNASAPMPLCSTDLYLSLLANKVYADFGDPNGGAMQSEITAHIDAAGRANYTVAFLKDGQKQIKTLEFNSPFLVEWAPSVYNGKTLPSEFTVYANIEPNTDATPETFRRFNWSKE